MKLGWKLLFGNGHCTTVSIRGMGLKYYCKRIKLFLSYAKYINNFNRFIHFRDRQSRIYENFSIKSGIEQYIKSCVNNINKLKLLFITHTYTTSIIDTLYLFYFNKQHLNSYTV